jgi:hypothetical protein
MSDPNEFTPKEKFIISLYKQPDVLFRKSVQRTMSFIVVSIALVAYAFVQGDVAMGMSGYAVLLIYLVIRLIQLKRGVQILQSIFAKYDAQLQNKKNAA